VSDLAERLNSALATRYKIEAVLGTGGMATVFLAQDLRHRRKVAIKVLHPELAAVLGTDRFLREIEIAAGLSHPHILPLYDSGSADGQLYYVMPYAGGESLRQRLERYLNEHGISWKGAAFYSHLLPALDTKSWKRNRVAGEGWMAVGDAAGLVDPVTGEGLYYAIRSADLAAQTLLADAAPAENPEAYRKLLRRDFAADLEFGSRLAKRVFMGRFLLGSVPQRMVQFTRRSPRFASIMQDLFAGRQPYLGLKRRLMENLNGSLYEIAMSFGFSRIVPRAAKT